MGADADQRGRFVWPPRAGAEVRARDGVGAAAGSDSCPIRAGEREAGEGPGGIDDPGASASGVGLRGGGPVWGSIERALLGPVSVSFGAAARQAAWSPDAPGAWCGRCGTSVGPFEADGDGCPACRSRRLAWGRFVRVAAYEGLLREAIGELKFGGWKRLAGELGGLLGVALRRELAAAGLDPAAAVLVPVPTSRRRRLATGVDHTALLARAAAEACGGRMAAVLSRRHGPHQTGLAAAERRSNVRGVFARRGGLGRGWAARRLAEEGVVWVVVDDIRTTGATMTEACRALRGTDGSGRGGTIPEERVWAGVVAVTPERGRRGRGSQGPEGGAEERTAGDAEGPGSATTRPPAGGEGAT